ncbi:hypothetical protein PR048_026937 [Dryococelus australis]|uniref:Uncharacterized protein n=1 Tax=Dryococelus australis TaxID=614101 RepID=A0ABQ9GMR0_9NEOP|nr:hypothetical protein PR048_026937 [Dryococelus australis]
MDGLAGPLIVRQPYPRDPHGNLCDGEHVVFITDWMHELSTDRFPGRALPTVGRNPNQVPDNILVNGKGNYTVVLTYSFINH